LDPLHIWHLILISAWAGLVLAEVVMEAVCRTEAGLRQAAEIHFWLDVLLEVPLIAGVLATGAVLTLRAWPVSTIHWVKIGAALIAIGWNLYCVVVVARRRRSVDDVAALRRYRARVFLSLAGVPFGLVALYLGLAYLT
jgi:hypothetical protein